MKKLLLILVALFSIACSEDPVAPAETVCQMITFVESDGLFIDSSKCEYDASGNIVKVIHPDGYDSLVYANNKLTYVYRISQGSLYTNTNFKYNGNLYDEMASLFMGQERKRLKFTYSGSTITKLELYRDSMLREAFTDISWSNGNPIGLKYFSYKTNGDVELSFNIKVNFDDKMNLERFSSFSTIELDQLFCLAKNNRLNIELLDSVEADGDIIPKGTKILDRIGFQYNAKGEVTYYRALPSLIDDNKVAVENWITWDCK